MFRDRRVLVTGGSGMIGRLLVELLLERGAQVRVASLDDPDLAPEGAEFVRGNLLDFQFCLDVCRGVETVFHVAGIKGSPAVARARPASFFVPLITMNTIVMEAARRCAVEDYLYTSSVGVYAPAEVFHEDDVWRTLPSDNDRFAGWAKRMGELQAQAYAEEFGWRRIAIVRPANVYGPHDDFDPEGAMVIPSLIRRVVEGETPLTVWGDGSAIRDFIHARDVARGMLFALEHEIYEPLNLGSGKGVSIRQLVDLVVENVDPRPQVAWDTSRPTGDRKRVLDMSRTFGHGFQLEVPIAQGIRETMAWYREHRGDERGKLNVFRDGMPGDERPGGAR